MIEQLSNTESEIKIALSEKLCTRCGANPARDRSKNQPWCKPCYAVTEKARRTRLTAEGLCIICGERPRTLDLRGIKNKGTRLSRMCEPCILKRQTKTRVTHIENKKRAMAHFNNECLDCGLKTHRPEVYQFHHLDPLTKSYNISARMSKPWNELELELAKCVMLCANCHIIREVDSNWKRTRIN